MPSRMENGVDMTAFQSWTKAEFGYSPIPNLTFVFGLSALLFGEITIDKGRAVETNFDTYPVMRIADMPKVDTIIASSGGFWGGVGEPTIAVAGPAVLNAIFAAERHRQANLGWFGISSYAQRICE